jgi:release factor glutamine methyltransferase
MTSPQPLDDAETVGAALARATAVLREAGIATARLDSRLLLCAALGESAERLVGWPERVLSAAEVRAFAVLMTRRLAREPVAQILGQREFWSLPFATTRDTLTPRPDSETIVEAALAAVRDRPGRLRCLDLGTGTGCLLLALLTELPGATGVGTDISPAAARVASANAAKLGLAERAQFVVTSWDEGLAGQFDIIVSNPPYIRTAELETLEPDVRLHEPRLALDGGADGLAAYRALAPRLLHRLAPGGLGILEVGDGQAEQVELIMRDAGLVMLGHRTDLAGRNRCILVGR